MVSGIFDYIITKITRFTSLKRILESDLQH